MALQTYYDKDADLARLAGKTGAVVGYGSQGHAHALNLSHSGVSVVVGLRKDSSSWGKAEAATKATSSIIAPISGKVIEVNEDLSESPEVLNEDPYGKGWIAVLEIDDPSEADDLMDASEYWKYVEEEAK